MGKLVTAQSIDVQGNNGGSYISIQEIAEGMIRLGVGETCVTTIQMEISVAALACILTQAHEIGFQKMLDDYLRVPRGSPETITLDADLAVRMRKARKA